MSRVSRLLAIVGTVALVVGGCAAQASPVGTPPATAVPTIAAPRAATAAPASSASRSPASAAPSASADPSASVVVTEPLPEGGQTVFPGRYTTHFKPSMTLTVGSEVELSCVPGYRCRGDVDVNLPGWVGFEFGNAPAFEVNVGRIDKVFDPQHKAKLIAPPKDLAAWIEKLPGISFLAPPKTVKVGGLDAVQLDVRGGAKEVLIGPIPGVAEFKGFGIGPRGSSRLIVVRVQGHDVLIFVDSADDGAQFMPATETLQPLVDSIVWR